MGKPKLSATKTLRERCAELLDALDDIIASDGYRSEPKQEEAVDLLVGFVQAEHARGAEKGLEGKPSLILFFEDEAGREEFVEVVYEYLPHMKAKELP